MRVHVLEREVKANEHDASGAAVETLDEPMSNQLLDAYGFTTGTIVESVYTQMMEPRQFGTSIYPGSFREQLA